MNGTGREELFGEGRVRVTLGWEHGRSRRAREGGWRDWGRQ